MNGGDAMSYKIKYDRKRVVKRKAEKGSGLLGSFLILVALLIRLLYPDFTQCIRNVMLKKEAVTAFAQDFSAAVQVDGNFWGSMLQ
jgi:hypothetical protein